MSNYIHYKVTDKITYPFPHFNRAAVEVWEGISNFIPHFTGHLIKSPQSGVTLCFQFVSAAASAAATAAAAMTFASHVKTVWASP